MNLLTDLNENLPMMNQLTHLLKWCASCHQIGQEIPESNVVVEALVLLRQTGDFSQCVPSDGAEKREVVLGIRPFLRHHVDLEEIQEGVPVARTDVLVLALWMFALELFLRQITELPVPFLIKWAVVYVLSNILFALRGWPKFVVGDTLGFGTKARWSAVLSKCS